MWLPPRCPRCGPFRHNCRAHDRPRSPQLVSWSILAQQLLRTTITLSHLYRRNPQMTIYSIFRIGPHVRPLQNSHIPPSPLIMKVRMSRPMKPLLFSELCLRCLPFKISASSIPTVAPRTLHPSLNGVQTSLRCMQFFSGKLECCSHLVPPTRYCYFKLRSRNGSRVPLSAQYPTFFHTDPRGDNYRVGDMDCCQSRPRNRHDQCPA